LKPATSLEEAIAKAKSKTESIAGNQTYLKHAPHLTLYVSAFNNVQTAIETAKQVAATIATPRFEIMGWHYFAGDPLTGKQTLVCNIKESDRTLLRHAQAAVLDALAALRDEHASTARYAVHFDQLSTQRRNAVEKWGYPFIADDWIPHLTIASIDPAEWERVWEALKDDAPVGQHTCDQLYVFQLDDDFPSPIAQFPLGG
jgi:hypothetical protein